MWSPSISRAGQEAILKSHDRGRAIVPQRLVDIIQGNNLFAKRFGTSLPYQERSTNQQFLLIQGQPAQSLYVAA